MNTTWNFDLLQSDQSEAAWKLQRTQIEGIVSQFVDNWESVETYLKDAPTLLSALNEYEHLIRSTGTSGTFGFLLSLQTSLDQSNADLKSREQQIDNFSREQSTRLQFFELRLSKLPTSKQKEFLTAPELLPYRHFLEKLFLAGTYLLSEAEEKIITLKSYTAYESWLKLRASQLAKQEEDVLLPDGTNKSQTFSDIINLIDHPEKTVRDSAASAFNRILSDNLDLAEAEMNAIMADRKVEDELRGRNRPDLGRHIADDIDSATVDTLIQTIISENAIAHRYYKLKAQLLGQSTLAYHERNVEISNIQKEIPYSEAITLVTQTFDRLDPEFATIFTDLCKNKIDVYPAKGKRDGAFCAWNLVSQPTYILLNYGNRLDDVLTLAHEAGHAIHAELTKNTQHALNFDIPMATAEVASTFMEDFVLDTLAETADDATKLGLMMTTLNSDISTIFRQANAYALEQELHSEFRKQGHISAQVIGELFQKHMRAYMGNAVTQDPGSENWWVYWGHLRTYFYNYSYASGLLISKALQGKVRSNPEFIQHIKKFFSAGSSESPEAIFLAMGITIQEASFWKAGIAEISTRLDEVTHLARKLGRIPE